MKILKGAGFDAKRPDRLDVAMCKDLPIKLVPPPVFSERSPKICSIEEDMRRSVL